MARPFIPRAATVPATAPATVPAIARDGGNGANGEARDKAVASSAAGAPTSTVAHGYVCRSKARVVRVGLLFRRIYMEQVVE